MSLLQLAGYFTSKKLCLTLFCSSRSNWYDDDGNKSSVHFFIAKLFMQSLNKNNQRLQNELSCFLVKHDEGGLLLWCKVNRLKTIMWYACCQLNHIWLSFQTLSNTHTQCLIHNLLHMLTLFFSCFSKF